MNATATSQAPAWSRLLPADLLTLPLQRLALPAAVREGFAANGVLTVQDALAAPWDVPGGPCDDGRGDALAAALSQALQHGLAQFSTHAEDWPTLRAQLLGPLDDTARDWFTDLVGFDQDPPPVPALARSRGTTTAALDEHAEHIRATLAERARPLLARLHQEAATDLRAHDGVLPVEHAAAGSMVAMLARSAPDRALGLRLIAFLFAGECHYHRGVLFGVAPRRYRRLLRMLPAMVPPHRLPLAVDTLLEELRAQETAVPRGVLLYVLRRELHVAIELDATRGEVATSDPRTPAARLVELLQENGGTATLADIVYAHRERFRRGSAAAIARHLRRQPEFVQLGPETWALRAEHQKELQAVQPLVDKVARRIVGEGGRHHVADLLPPEERDERTVFYVLDRLAADPRVRLLGRGDACAASHRRSLVLDTLVTAFRRAGGDVVLGKFLDNQPPERRRLVERLLMQNRLFVQPADDRIDVLTNWPFNEERLSRLVALVQDQLRSRVGYAHVSALKAIVDRTDLGGEWLTVPLLTDVLRRNGPFQALPGGLLARAELDLAGRVRRALRQAMRSAGVALSVEEILKAKPELHEFTPCLRQLLEDDPSVQTADGLHFKLA